MIEAAKIAKTKKCFVVTFTGFHEDNPLKQFGDINFWVDSNNYNIVESIHNSWVVLIAENISNDDKRIGLHGLDTEHFGKS